MNIPDSGPTMDPADDGENVEVSFSGTRSGTHDRDSASPPNSTTIGSSVSEGPPPAVLVTDGLVDCDARLSEALAWESPSVVAEYRAATTSSRKSLPGAYAQTGPADHVNQQQTLGGAIARMSASNNGRLPDFKDQARSSESESSNIKKSGRMSASNNRLPDFKDQMRSSEFSNVKKRSSGPHLTKGTKDQSIEDAPNSQAVRQDTQRSTQSAEDPLEVLITADLVRGPDTLEDGAVLAVPFEGERRKRLRAAGIAVVGLLILLLAGAIVGAVLATRNDDAPVAVAAASASSSLACRKATSLSLGTIVVGTTNGGTMEDVSVCGTVTAIMAPGTWFRYEPKRLTSAVRITTCTNDTSSLNLGGVFDSQMVVFQEPITNGGTCDQLFCLQGNDNEGGDGCDHSSTAAGVTFTPFPTKLYHVLVYAYAQGATGDFSIEAQAIEETPKNDKCPGAIPLRDGEIVALSTLDATSKDVTQLGVCGGATPAVSAGVWFSYTSDENGSEVRITTCTSDSLLNGGGYDSLMVVYKGDCQNLECIAGNDDERHQEQCVKESGVTFRPDPSTTYIVYVYGKNEDERGNFAVEAKEP